jgi:hypothetical protein
VNASSNRETGSAGPEAPDVAERLRDVGTTGARRLSPVRTGLTLSGQR